MLWSFTLLYVLFPSQYCPFFYIIFLTFVTMVTCNYSTFHTHILIYTLDQNNSTSALIGSSSETVISPNSHFCSMCNIHVQIYKHTDKLSKYKQLVLVVANVHGVNTHGFLLSCCVVSSHDYTHVMWLHSDNLCYLCSYTECICNHVTTSFVI